MPLCRACKLAIEHEIGGTFHSIYANCENVRAGRTQGCIISEEVLRGAGVSGPQSEYKKYFGTALTVPKPPPPPAPELAGLGGLPTSRSGPSTTPGRLPAPEVADLGGLPTSRSGPPGLAAPSGYIRSDGPPGLAALGTPGFSAFPGAPVPGVPGRARFAFRP